jgi:hypothetical protein
MCCFFTSWSFSVSRGPALVIQWREFSRSLSIIDPGIIFGPTTMMYVIVFPGGVTGWDWLWLGIGLLGDIAWWAGGGFRRRVPRYTGQY